MVFLGGGGGWEKIIVFSVFLKSLCLKTASVYIIFHLDS